MTEEYKYRTPINVEWVAGRFEGKMAIEVKGLAKERMGYFILDQGVEWVNAAFRRPINSSTPDHLTKIIDPFQIAKLEAKRNNKPEPKRIYHHEPKPVIEIIEKNRLNHG